MTKIFFFSPNGYAPMKGDKIRALCSSHGWQDTGQSWVYGVAIPKPGVDPHEVADALTAAGITVFPGVHDHQTKVDGGAAQALAAYGVLASDLGQDVAAKMAKACGMPILRPHLW